VGTLKILVRYQIIKSHPLGCNFSPVHTTTRESHVQIGAVGEARHIRVGNLFLIRRHRILDFINACKNGLLYSIARPLNTSPYAPKACYESSSHYCEAIENLEAACFARILLLFLSSFSSFSSFRHLNSMMYFPTTTRYGHAPPVSKSHGSSESHMMICVSL